MSAFPRELWRQCLIFFSALGNHGVGYEIASAAEVDRRPIVRRNSTPFENSSAALLLDQPNSSEHISITRGSASNAASAFKKARRVRRAKTSTAVHAYSY